MSQRGLSVKGQIVLHYLRRAAAQGIVCYGPDERGKPTHVLLSDWTELGGAKERGAALAQLIRQYLSTVGQASAEHFAVWSGLNL